MDQDTYTINTSPINVNFGEGNYSATLIRNGNQVTISSTGTVNNETRRLLALIELRSVLADYLVLVNRNGGTWTSGSGAQYGQPDPIHPEYPEGVPLSSDDRMKMYIMGD